MVVVKRELWCKTTGISKDLKVIGGGPIKVTAGTKRIISVKTSNKARSATSDSFKVTATAAIYTFSIHVTLLISAAVTAIASTAPSSSVIEQFTRINPTISLAEVVSSSSILVKTGACPLSNTGASLMAVTVIDAGSVMIL